MRCFYHPESEAVGICKNCGRGLCTQCAHELEQGLACRGKCESQVTEFDELRVRSRASFDVVGRAYRQRAALWAVLAIVALVLGAHNIASSEEPGFGYFLAIAGIVFIIAAVQAYSVGRKYSGACREI